jgi:hypothetical protein
VREQPHLDYSLGHLPQPLWLAHDLPEPGGQHLELYCGIRQKYCTWSVRRRGMKLGDSSELVYIKSYITADLSI